MILKLLQAGASAVATRVGHGAAPIRMLRPSYEALLGALSGGRGVAWSINDEVFRIDPTQRRRLGHTYEPEVALLLRDRLARGMTFLDVGANVGAYVLQAARLVGDAGRVIAVEPNPEAVRYLLKHVRFNKFENQVTILPIAAGKDARIQTLFALGSDGMSRLGKRNELLPGARPIETRVETLDQCFPAGGHDPDVMLIDVEGYEMDVLAGARRLIARSRLMTIIVEMHPDVWPASGTTPSEARTLLRELGLRPIPLNKYSDPFRDYGIAELIRGDPGT